VQDLLLCAKHLFVEAMLHFSGVGSSQSQMLALTDAALARLCIGATRIRPGRRQQWLREIAAKLDRPQRHYSMTPSAIKKREQRKRSADGSVVLYTKVKEADFAEALLRSKHLTEAETLRRDKLTAAAEVILKEFTRRWLAEPQA
jgi:hypothetical protein